MRKFGFFFFSFLLIYFQATAQMSRTQKAIHWADSVFNTLNDNQRIAQLMVLRESSFTKDGPVYYDSMITAMIRKYDIGGIVLFQGGPIQQANFINYFQKIAKTPLLICVDAEWGLGMRMDSVIPLNHQMMLGAISDTSIISTYGKLVANQCRREGIQVNFAPVVDINNNPENPVIGDRSFGENKFKVATDGVTYMKALQREGILACAKHFPGHGDVSVDSYLDLPVIDKTMKQLSDLELYPFEKMIAAGVGSIMIAHLYVPAIDSTPNLATSLSRKTVTGLLREKLHFKGLTFTDALDMKGVAKYFPEGTIAARSLIAGNDILSLPGDVDTAIAKIRQAIESKKISWNDIYSRCKKVLECKYLYGAATAQQIDTMNLVKDLNAGTNRLKKLVAENALTVLKETSKSFFPLSPFDSVHQVAYVGIGIDSANTFARKLQEDYDADVFYFNYKKDSVAAENLLTLLKNYTHVIIGVHNYARFPESNFGISNSALDLINKIQEQDTAIIFDFGSPYLLKNFCSAKNLVACYDDDSVTQKVAVELLEGRIPARGKLPVTVCNNYKYGSGIIDGNLQLPLVPAGQEELDADKLAIIDSIANDGIAAGAYPGCIVLAARNGKTVFAKAYGKYNYDTPQPVSLNSIYDMASVTKICATTLAVMKLYDQGKIKLYNTLGYYLPWVRGSNKAHLRIRDILLHQAGLIAYIPFYKNVIDPETGEPLPRVFSHVKTKNFDIRVAQNLYMRHDYRDTMYKLILESRLGKRGRYVYSDNDFIFMGKIVEALSGMSLNKYVDKNFYKPMGLTSTGFLPREKFDTNRIAPTENEKQFRMQHLHGDVHDPGSAMFGEVAGHAGLFSDVSDLSAIMQMLLNGGVYKGKRYIKSSTIRLFTAYNSHVSRRGLGFDKPEKDNAIREEPYPAKSVSPLTFGHTGFTGTCVWADPKYDIIFIFLSNRVNPYGGENLKLLHMDIRGKIQEAIYQAMKQ
jgi:beta-N-acetylhexosaminidase